MFDKFLSTKRCFLFTDVFERHSWTDGGRPERREIDVNEGTIRRRVFGFVSGHFSATKNDNFNASDFLSLAHNIRPNIVSIDEMLFFLSFNFYLKSYRQTANSYCTFYEIFELRTKNVDLKTARCCCTTTMSRRKALNDLFQNNFWFLDF